MFDNISVIIPIVRPAKAKRCIESIELHCPGVEIITGLDTEGIGCPRMVERLTARATRQVIVFLGDDTIVQAGMLQNAVREMEALPDGWGVVGLNTSPGNDHAHWMADRRILDHIPGGNFFPTEYHHCYGDDELKDIAVELGRWAYASDAVVEHDHPINGGEGDEFYGRAYGSGWLEADRATYFRRKRDRYGNKIAIGFPLVDSTVHVRFFTSFACMDKPDQYTLLIPQFPHGPWSGSIADARNSLVEQAQQDGCRYLLMLDTDQVYPTDTLPKLLSHEVDICGVRVHRRWMPFDPIFLRGELGSYASVPEEEMYSGDLIKVDATGTGCLLFKMEVFDKIPQPWFAFGTHKDKPVGEDIHFCTQARKSGVDIWIDTSIEVGHLTTVEVTKFLHQLCKNIKPKMDNIQ